LTPPTRKAREAARATALARRARRALPCAVAEKRPNAHRSLTEGETVLCRERFLRVQQ